VYTNGTSTCPNTCPPAPADRVENFFNAKLCTDYMCDPAPDPSFRTFSAANQCYLIRIGGNRDLAGNPTVDPVGRVRLDIASEEVACPITIPPIEDPGVPDFGNGTKNRYMSMDASTLSPARAGLYGLRVTFVSLPAPFEYANGRQMWIQEPFVVTEASGSGGPTPPPTFYAATLGCAPFYTDWSAYGLFDVYDAAILPGAVFEVQTIEQTCDRASEDSYSTPLTVAMSRAGDILGTGPGTSPQGVIDFVDISADVDKFRNLASAPRKAQADLVNSDISQALPDLKIDFVDISYCVDAFRNQVAPLPGPPVTDPCGP